MVSKFDEVLAVLQGPPDDPGVRMGVCAMGPVAPGDRLTWMRVWVFQEDQQDPARAAAATGTSGTHLGGHDKSKKEVPPFSGNWMIQTELEPGSEQFSGGKPALAMAMAMVTHEDGSQDVEQWSQAVLIAEQHDHDH